jgi:hypothetical protein
VSIDEVRLDQLEAMLRQLQLAGDGRKVGELITAGVDVRPEARERDLFGEGHTADGMVSLEDQDFEPRPREVTGARQPVVPRADDDGVVPHRHRFTSRSPRRPPLGGKSDNAEVSGREMPVIGVTAIN